MKTKFGCLMVCLSLVLVNTAAAQDGSQASQYHEVLKLDVGTWDAKMKIWMPGQEEPIEAEGVETNKMLGDVWLVSEFKGNFLGQPFEGRGQFGYDDAKKMYVGTWIDSVESHMSTMQGTWDYDTQTMTMISKGRDPETGEPNEGKTTAVYKDDDTRVMTMHMKIEGEYVKSMEIVYTRK